MNQELKGEKRKNMLLTYLKTFFMKVMGYQEMGCNAFYFVIRNAG
jgi:hypothetical protein